jgi:hypothetical protein
MRVIAGDCLAAMATLARQGAAARAAAYRPPRVKG